MNIREKVTEWAEESKKFDLGGSYIMVIPSIMTTRPLGVPWQVKEVLDDGFIDGNDLLIPYVYAMGPMDETTANHIKAQRAGIVSATPEQTSKLLLK